MGGPVGWKRTVVHEFFHFLEYEGKGYAEKTPDSSQERATKFSERCYKPFRMKGDRVVP